MKFEYILPIIALLIGWFLNEAGGYFKMRRQNKQAIGRALADLLHVHHELSIYRRTLAGVQDHLSIPVTELFPIRQTLVQKFLSSNISTRYEKAVTTIASNDPLLGFELRSRTSVARVLENLGSLFIPGSKFDNTFFEMEAKFLDAAIDALKITVLDVSKKHGWLTSYRIKRYLSKERSLGAGSKEILRITNQAIQKFEKPSSRTNGIS